MIKKTYYAIGYKDEADSTFELSLLDEHFSSKAQAKQYLRKRAKTEFDFTISDWEIVKIQTIIFRKPLDKPTVL